MSPQKSSEKDPRLKYLDRILRLNPLQDPQGVLTLRRRTLGLKPVRQQTAIAVDPQTQQKRQAVRAYVEKIQTDFWTMPLEELKRSLSAVDVRETPELRPLVGRLRTVAACRTELPKLLSSKGADPGLIHAFKSVVISPATEAGPQRERFLRSITDRQRLRKVQGMVRKIKNDHSLIYELERDWFDTILAQKRPKAAYHDPDDDYSPEVSLSLELSWPVMIVILIALRVLLRLL